MRPSKGAFSRFGARWSLRPVAGFAFVGSILAVAAAGDERMLLDFRPPFHADAIERTDANVRLVANDSTTALRVETGSSQKWPGIALSAPQGRWDLSSFAYVETVVRNVGTNHVTVNCRVDNPGADGTRHCVTGSADIEPGKARTVRVPLWRTSGDTLGGKLFAMRGYPAKPGGERTVDPASVTRMLVFVNEPSASHAFEVGPIRAAGTWTPPTASTADAEPYFPLIDTFGQYRHKDWPGKTHSLAEPVGRRDTEAAELERDSGPTDWNRFGGWTKGPRLEPTGFFRVEKVDGRWWLVDPEGRLFWSHGIDCVRMLDRTVVEERESWFEDFPGNHSEFAEFAADRGRALKGHFASRSVRSFSFAGANLKRKYGEDWRRHVPETIHRRLRAWGLNTIGNWSDDGVRSLRRTPYVDSIGSYGAVEIEGSEGYWGRFPDVFDSSFELALRKSMSIRAAQSANDAWCIGYFCDNELSWGDAVSLALAALRSPARQAAKQAFVADLRKRHGEIAKLNDAWGTRHASWDALLASRDAPDVERARTDLETFTSRTADLYFATVRKVIRDAAPKQLYLGCRFAWANSRAAAAAARHCDVVSYNLYGTSIADFAFDGGKDVPLIVGEFHFGALDRGLFHTGLVPTANQAERATAYREYVEGALRHPHFVGCHWFQYQDEPTTGREYDEENYQIGFVDVADTPYAEIVAASRYMGSKLYEVRRGK